MDLEVVGRHALLFDDDAMLRFVNSSDALVEWHSLPIDRYDVRHLLSSPPPPRKGRRNPNSLSLYSSSTDPTDLELDHERYLDLPELTDEQEVRNDGERFDAGTYHTVGFSYGISGDTTNQKVANGVLEGSGFRPSFPVPESLFHRLPPTEKLHQIIARTAIFVSKHGGQSEIVLRVKQGDNPTFGFLMPDHHLHDYFRFLVDHQEVLEIEKKPENGHNIQAVDVEETGALSLLGSVYGSVEDEDGATEDRSEDKDDAPTVTDKFVNSEITVNLEEKDQTLPNHEKLISKEKKLSSKATRFTSSVKSGADSNLSKDSEAPALKNALKVEELVVEPPSDIKKQMKKIIEFIMKNGKEFEAVLIDQDTKYGRFPFLLPSNLYYSYYIKALEKAQELKTCGKSLDSEKVDSWGHKNSDIPFDSDKKEKFKMVMNNNKPKKDVAWKTSDTYTVSMDASAAEAIIQAARKGIKYPNLESFAKVVASNNADSSETKEQKLKAERLKRAKMFASLIKSGSVPLDSGNITTTSTSEQKERRSKRSYRSKDKDTSSSDDDGHHQSCSDETKRKHRKRHSSSSYSSKHHGRKDDKDDDETKDKETTTTTVVPDELRAKIRAMLMTTLQCNNK